jgi:hypothetical protein
MARFTDKDDPRLVQIENAANELFYGVSDWRVDIRKGVLFSVQFFVMEEIMLAKLIKFSAAIDNDHINLYFGSQGEPGYSDITPGSDAQEGYIEVILWR